MVNSPFVPAEARRPATAVIVVAAPPDVDHPAGRQAADGAAPEIGPSSL
jgi:hypothetical protein